MRGNGCRARHIIYDPLTSAESRLTLAGRMASGLQDTPRLQGAHDDYWIKIHRRAMACRFEITLDSRDARFVPAAQEALNLVDAIEAQLTVFRDTSALVHLNAHAATE